MEKAVVTGVGVVSPVGIGKEKYVNALKSGISGMKKFDFFEVPKNRSIAASIPELPYSDYSRGEKALNIAVQEALIDSNLDCKTDNDFACLLGTMAGDSRMTEEVIFGLKEDVTKFSDDLKKEAFNRYGMSSLIDRISLNYNLGGTRMVASNACASSNIILGYALDLIRFKKTDVVVVCGIDMLKEIIFWGSEGLKILGPELKAFDKNRQGTVLGEGAGVIILESESHAKSRNAKIYVEFAGYGVACDTQVDMIIPQSDGMGLSRAIEQAIEDSCLENDSIGYINAHGTGTKNIDLVETKAIKNVFKERSYEIPVSSTKTIIGHTHGAGGVLESIATILAITGGFYPPTLNYSNTDPELDLDYVTDGSRSANIDAALSCNLGGGGVNSIVVFSKKNRNVSNKDIDLKKQIVITGLGCVSPFGNSVCDFVNRNNILPKNGCYRIQDFNLNNISNDKRFHRYNLAGQYALASSIQAFTDSQLYNLQKERVGVLVGTTYGGYTTVGDTFCKILREQHPNYITPYLVMHSGGHNLGASLIAQKCQIEGMYSTVTTGITAGIDSINYALSLIQSGRMDAMLVCGVDILDAPLFNAYQYLDKIDNNVILSEGSGTLVLESYETATRRNANIYGVVGEYCSKPDLVPVGKILKNNSNQTQVINYLSNITDNCKFIYSHNFDCSSNKGEIEFKRSDKVFGEAHSAVSMLAMIDFLSNQKMHGDGIFCASAFGGMNSAVLIKKR